MHLYFKTQFQNIFIMFETLYLTLKRKKKNKRNTQIWEFEKGWINILAMESKCLAS